MSLFLFIYFIEDESEMKEVVLFFLIFDFTAINSPDVQLLIIACHVMRNLSRMLLMFALIPTRTNQFIADVTSAHL